jgi:CHRD domain.
MKKTIIFSGAIYCLLLISMISFSSCHKDNNTTTTAITYKLSGNATGDQEVPAVSTTGSGTLTGTLDNNTNALHYSVAWTSLSGPATAAHFHGPAPAGTNSGVVIPFHIVNNGNSGAATGDTTLTDAQKADLIAGKWYWNVHTAAHGGGEIRAQVIVTQ